ncbi:MAG TPA: hypothetical protein VER36_11715 [Flavisolibacter sp.]|nr:hypothetical protein [Flavisolibacter sp.]
MCKKFYDYLSARGISVLVRIAWMFAGTSAKKKEVITCIKNFFDDLFSGREM